VLRISDIEKTAGFDQDLKRIRFRFRDRTASGAIPATEIFYCPSENNDFPDGDAYILGRSGSKFTDLMTNAALFEIQVETDTNLRKTNFTISYDAIIFIPKRNTLGSFINTGTEYNLDPTMFFRQTNDPSPVNVYVDQSHAFDWLYPRGGGRLAYKLPTDTSFTEYTKLEINLSLVDRLNVIADPTLNFREGVSSTGTTVFGNISSSALKSWAPNVPVNMQFTLNQNIYDNGLHIEAFGSNRYIIKINSMKLVP
jgi:hypothetical protein